MSSSYTLSESSFDREILDLTQKLECRAAILDAEKEQIYRLRHTAYLLEGAVPAGPPQLFKDRLDETENGKIFGLYIDGRLASTIRLHVATPAAPICPAMTAFADCVLPMLDSGLTVIDPTRFVLDANFARQYRKLPYVTARVAWMACEQLGAAVLLATVRPEHQAFYKGLFGHRVVSGARPYPSLSKPVSLMALNINDERERVLRRHPFLRSTEVERSALFGSAFGLGTTKSPGHRKGCDLAIPLDPRAGRQLHPGRLSAVA